MAQLEVGDTVQPDWIGVGFARLNGLQHHRQPGAFREGASWAVYTENVIGRHDIHQTKNYPHRVAVARQGNQFVLVSKQARHASEYTFHAGPFPTLEGAQVAYLLEMLS